MRVLRLVMFAAFWMASTAWAAFPDQPIKLVVPYDPGTVDAAGRIVARRMEEDLKTTIVIENVAGAAGTIGSARVAKAPPDGYTILYGSSSVFVQDKHFYKLSFDPAKDFVPICGGLKTGLFLLVNNKLGVKTLAELVALAKAQPGKLTYGSSGNGSSGNIAGEVLKQRAGLDITHVPYKNSGTTLTDLLGGRISMFFYTYQFAEPYLKNGTLIALGYTGKERLPAAPTIPTFAESGFPGFDQGVWFSFFAPAATPKDVVARLNAAVRHGLQAEELKKFYDWVPMPTTPEGLGQLVTEESRQFDAQIKTLDIKTN